MKKLFFFIFIVVCSVNIYGQDLLRQDLRTIQVDKLSDNEILYYYNRLQQSNVTLDQAEQIAASKGMPQEEIAKLRQRINSLLLTNNKQGGSQGMNARGLPGDSLMNIRMSEADSITLTEERIDKQIFGSELFRTTSTSFEPNLRIATPVNYPLGPDDELNIDVFGYSEAHYKLKVNPEGNIYIPNVGPVYVNGLTVEDASAKIKSKLAATIYKAIGTGNTRVQVSLGNIKSIRVTIIGEAKKPGTYTVSSLSTVFNALYLCGGPSINGTYRNVELLRNNKVVTKIDLYDFLLSGNQSNNVRLMDQDVIRIPYYTNRVTLKGEIKRPAIYEFNEGDQLQQILKYAGGFTDSAYRSAVKITQLTEKERRVVDVSSKDYATYKLQSSDVITIDKILNRYTNRVQVKGAVMRPGEFELTNGLTLKQLIEKADGLREDAFVERGEITRLKEDLSLQAVSFNVAGILNGSESDIPLKREDVINISSIFDLQDTVRLTIQGEVRTPGRYQYKDSISIEDLIIEAGGFTEAATAKRIEIARRVTNADVNSSSTEIAKIIQVDSEKDLHNNNNKYYLRPYDLVIIRNNPGYFTQRTVTIDGEVMYPGAYAINSIDEKLSNIINRAGGFKITADASAASLRRVNAINAITELKNTSIEKIARDRGTDTTAADSLSREAVRPYDIIGINLEEVMDHPGITNDLILENGDIVYIPKKNQAVKVRGEVLFPTQFAFRENRSMKYYIDQAGGFSSNALKRKAFVLGANGNARKVRHFLFFKSYPSIKAGDEVFVPKKPERKGLSTGEIIGITTAVVSFASVVIALITNLK